MFLITTLLFMNMMTIIFYTSFRAINQALMLCVYTRLNFNWSENIANYMMNDKFKICFQVIKAYVQLTLLVNNMCCFH